MVNDAPELGERATTALNAADQMTTEIKSVVAGATTVMSPVVACTVFMTAQILAHGVTETGPRRGTNQVEAQGLTTITEESR